MQIHSKHGDNMDIKKANANFSVEQLLTGNLAKNQFKVDYLPMWQFLDNWERKAGGFDNVSMKDIFEGIYEFGVITVSLDKADMQGRIDYLNQKNLEIFIKCENLLKENEVLKTKLQESQTIKENS